MQIQLIASVTTIKWMTFNAGACRTCDGARATREPIAAPRGDSSHRHGPRGSVCREYSVVKYSTSRCPLAHGHPGGLRAEPEAISARSKAVAGRARAPV